MNSKVKIFICFLLYFILFNNLHFFRQTKASQEIPAKFVEMLMGSHVPGKIILKLKKNSLPTNLLPGVNLFSEEKKISNFPPEYKPSQAGEDRFFAYKLVSKNESDLAQALWDLNSDPNVEYAEPSYYRFLDVAQQPVDPPNDSRWNDLWGMRKIQANLAWQEAVGRRHAGVVVAVIDTGADYTHPDLAANIWTNVAEIPNNGRDDDNNGYVDDVHGWDAFSNDGDPQDEYTSIYHGTHVAGTIGAVGNNNIGVVGVLGANTLSREMLLRIFGVSGNASDEDILESINYLNIMKQRGVNIVAVNMSWGGSPYSSSLENAIRALGSNSILAICSAGNAGSNNDSSPHYPSSYNLDNIISIASTEPGDTLSYFSNFGIRDVDIGAPGGDILSTRRFNQYAFLSGTSMAAPHVSGTAALISEVRSSLTMDFLKNLILSLGDRKESLNARIGSGSRLNVYNTLENDSIPPGTIDDLRVIENESTPFSLSLAFTLSGDDGPVTGRATKVDFRYSENANIGDEAGFNSATPLNVPVIGPGGTPVQVSVNGLKDGADYYFALRVVDNALNWSAISNVAHGQTKSIVHIFSDDMETDNGFWMPFSRDDRIWEHGVPLVGIASSHSGTKVWATNLSGVYGNGLFNGVQSQPIPSSGYENMMLSFWYSYDTETAYDGFIVEIKDENSDWKILIPEGGYPIQMRITSPFGAIGAYSGSSSDIWRRAFFLIPNQIKNNIQIKFVFGSDGSLSKSGVLIDDVEISVPMP